MIGAILAVDENGCIGKDNNLCWSLKKDLKFFSVKTKDSVVIMGKNTYLSLPEQFRPLPGRINIVLTKSNDFFDDKIYIANSITAALKLAESFNKNIFFIGGKKIYEQSIDYVDTIFITQVFKKFDCNICLDKSFFDEINLNFYLAKKSDILQENSVKFVFKEFKRFT